MPGGFPLQDEGPGMSEMFHDLAIEQEEERAKDRSRRERVATVLARRYPKVADKIRAGMRSSTWPEDLIDPGVLIDLLEQEESQRERLRATLHTIGAMVYMNRDGNIRFKPDYSPEDVLDASNAALEG